MNKLIEGILIAIVTTISTYYVITFILDYFNNKKAEHKNKKKQYYQIGFLSNIQTNKQLETNAKKENVDEN